MFKIFYKIIFVFIFIFSCITSVYGDIPTNTPYHQAVKAYDKGEFETAFNIFQDLAKIGNADAQYYLWIMYNNGEGIKKSFYKGFSWLSVLAERGDKDAVKTRDDILSKLTDKQRNISQKKVDEYINLYGIKALKEKLIPEFLSIDEKKNIETQKKSKTVQSDINSECVDKYWKIIEQVMARYPEKALAKSIQGYAEVEFLITKEGKAKNFNIVKSSNYLFERPTINAIKRWKFKKIKEYEEIVDCKLSYTMEFRVVGVNDRNDQLGMEYVADGKKNWYLQLQYGGLAFAQNGDVSAQFNVGLELLSGNDYVHKDEQKALRWFELAARKDHHNAQYYYAYQLNKNNKNHIKTQEVIDWMEKAIQGENQKAIQWLAYFLATTDNENYRDGEKALALSKKISSKERDYIERYKCLAASYAALGKFKKAIKYQKKGINRAEKFFMEVDLMDMELFKENLETYKKNQAVYD